MGRGMTRAYARNTTRHERNFWPNKGLPLFASGIIKFGRNSIVFSRPFGWRLKNTRRTIPHLNPLPLRKGEEKENKAALANSVRNRIGDPSPPRSRRGRG